MTRPGQAGGRREPRPDLEGAGWGLGLVVLPVAVCCGLPLVLTALAAAGAAVKGTVAGVVVAVAGVTAVVLLRRRARDGAACCAPPLVQDSASEVSEGDRR